MGKKMKKRARNSQKDKRGSSFSAKDDPQESHSGAETVDDRTVTEEEKENEKEKKEKKDRRVCVHLEKAIDLAEVSSKIESAESAGCEDCREGAIDRRGGKGKGKHSKKKGESSATWVCLRCGHFSCGGIGLPTSPQCHAVRHARQYGHPLVIQFQNPNLRWCFSCSTLIPVDKGEDGVEQKDVFSDVVKLLKKQSAKGSSLDVEDIWFGSGSVLSELKSENKEVNVMTGKNFHAARGLVNLGNTCFFNSVMQNLLAMDKLRECLLKYEGSMGPLTSSLKKIFVETSPETGLRNVINPKSLFGCVCTKAPQFRGYQQQDSHELLRCLLDGLSTEELCAKKSNGSSVENGEPIPVSPTFVDNLFGGQLSSTVCCVECGHSSVVYEPFLDLSLPVPTKKPPSKKTQPVRPRKTKPPPKRSARTRPKLNKDLGSAPVVIGCNPSISNESTSGSSVPSVSCSSSADIVESDTTVNGNGLVLQNSSNSTEGGYANIPVPESGTQEADALAWLDYLEPASLTGAQGCDDSERLGFLETVPLLDDQNLVSQNQDLPVNQDSGRTDLPVSSESTAVDLIDERPAQVQDNEILLLTYTEAGSTEVEGKNVGSEIASSAIAGGEDVVGFDGLGDLFNEPEVDVPTSSVATQSFGNGFVSWNNSESDPDEVDNTNSPVSIESCLVQFIKPELLSDEHAWHCENCSKVLREERRKMGKNQLKTGSVIQRSMSSDECSRIEASQLTGQSADCCPNTVLATHDKGSSYADENLSGLETMHINGHCPNSTAEIERSCEPENSCLHATGASTCVAPSDEASAGRESIDSDHESREDEEVDSKSVKVMRAATKRILIEKAPPILTIHLKRFGQDARGRLSKLNGYVSFKEYINLRSYLDSRSTERDDCTYRLVGVVVHSGTMKGGHYVAYVRGGDRQRGRPEEHKDRRCVWYYASDAHVKETTLEEVLSSEAYLLFYERVEP